jgi:hypothetical protein
MTRQPRFLCMSFVLFTMGYPLLLQKARGQETKINQASPPIVQPAIMDAAATSFADETSLAATQVHSKVITDGRGKESPAGPICGRYAENGCKRSGVEGLSRFAQCSVSAKQSVGYVGGGGSLLSGSQRYTHEGTFGLDYSGHWFHRKVWLLWNHGAKEQGGAGAYATDGPRILPE